MSKRHIVILATSIAVVLFFGLFGSRSLAMSSTPALSSSPSLMLAAQREDYQQPAVVVPRFNTLAADDSDEDQFRISDMGPDGVTDFYAYSSSVAYNSRDNEYLVVWWGEDDSETVDGYSSTVFGQRIDASTGAEIGANDFPISGGTISNCVNCYESFPAVTYNSKDNEYLVVWWSDIYTGGLTLDYDVFGQRLDAGGNEIGEDDFRISDMGNIDFRSTFISLTSPSAVFNPTNYEYFVVWFSEHDALGLVDDEWEIYGQRLEASTGAELGNNDFRISDMGGLGDASYRALDPVVTHNSLNNEYLVVWAGSDNVDGMDSGELEIFGQRLNAATGTEIGNNDFRISDMGGLGDASFHALDPAVTYSSFVNEYLVVWSGNDNNRGLADDENEIFGQRLNAVTGTEVGTNDFRVSGMGDTGDADFDAGNPAVVYDSRSKQYFVVWSGDDNGKGLVDDENEIFGQVLDVISGAKLGEPSFRISHMGPDRDTIFGGFYPAVAVSAMSNEYFVCWDGDDNSGDLVDGEFEIFGRFVMPDQYLYLPLIDRSG